MPEKDRAVPVRSLWARYCIKFVELVDWEVTLDKKGVESFLEVYPEVLGPSDDKLWQFVEAHSQKIDLCQVTRKSKVLLDLLDGHFGPTTANLKGHFTYGYVSYAGSLLCHKNIPG